MLVLLAGLVLFLGTHSIGIVAPAFRDRALGRLGINAWKGVYGILSLVGFVLICYGFALARQFPIVQYTPPRWLHHVAFLVWNDAVAVVLGLATYVFFILWAHVRLFGVSPHG